MGVRILGDSDGACMYCSTTMQAFGPVFEDKDDCQTFLDQYFPGMADPRQLEDSELSRIYGDYLAHKFKCDGCGEIALTHPDADDTELPPLWEQGDRYKIYCDDCITHNQRKRG